MLDKYATDQTAAAFLDEKEENFFAGINNFIKNNLGQTAENLIKGCVSLSSVYRPKSKTWLGAAVKYAALGLVESTQLLVRNAIRQPLKAVYHFAGATVSGITGLVNQMSGNKEKAEKDFAVARSHLWRFSKSVAISAAIAVAAGTVAATFGTALPFMPVASAIGGAISTAISGYVAGSVISTAIFAVPAL